MLDRSVNQLRHSNGYLYKSIRFWCLEMIASEHLEREHEAFKNTSPAAQPESDEIYCKLLSSRGCYQKYIKVYVVYNSETESNYWIDIRLYYNEKPTTYGVRLLAKEFEALYTKMIDVNPHNDYIKRLERPLGERYWQVYRHEELSFLWYLSVTKANGKETKLGLTWGECLSIISYGDVILKDCAPVLTK